MKCKRPNLGVHSFFCFDLSARNRKKSGGNMKLRQVIVVDPIRSRMAPKSGRERARSKSRATITVLNIIRLGPKPTKNKSYQPLSTESY